MTSLKFGTSGLRGLVTDLEGAPAREWTAAFLAHLGAEATRSGEFLVGHDLRASSPGIAASCMEAGAAAGLVPVDCGALPTPALALEATRRGAPAVMVTGSHIPDDRNGLKFYRAGGEITKADEAGILAAHEAGGLRHAADKGAAAPVVDASAEALARYRERYLGFFAPASLHGMRIGVYQHSSVARDLLVEVLEALGAAVEPLGRSASFVPVDTEAHRPEDVSQITAWAAEGSLNAIVSTDGDADRPLLADEIGRILRGDILGLLTARRLGLSTIVTPVTSSSAMERAGVATRVLRTRVGSPYVIEAMEKAGDAGGLIGFEANGGVLLGSAVEEEGRHLPALMTRDALLPILAVLTLARRENAAVSRLVSELKPGHALADRLKEVPASASDPFLDRLGEDEAFAKSFFASAGPVRAIDRTDGVRVTLEEGSVVHFRASGNAPELRCYVEADGATRADELLRWGLQAAVECVSD